MDMTPDHAKAPAGTLALAARLWRDYLSRYWPRFALALVAMGIYAASASAIPIAVEWINSGFAGGSARFQATARDVYIWGPVLVIGLGALNALSQYAQTRLSAGAALSSLRDMQREMFARLTGLDYAQIREDVSGQTISRFTNDTMVLRETLQRVSNAVRDLLTLAGLCATMIYYDLVLFLVVLLVYPVIGWPVAKIGKILRKASAKAQKQAGDVTALIGESVTGARMVKTYQLDGYENARAGEAFDERLGLLKKMAYTRGLNEPFVFFVGSIALGIIISVVAMRIMAGAINGPQFISFIIALLLMSQPARGLSTLNAVAQEGFAAFERTLDIIDARPRIVDAPDAEPLQVKAGAISMQNVYFAYNTGAPALDGLSLEIPAGAKIALVGESGAGKSTIFNLLPRLYEADGGEIEIDGQAITNVTLHSLREAMSLVSQDAILFNDTVAANISFGRAGADQSAIIDAAKAAAAHEFIEAMPQGYETIVGEGGANLSGGERQRIALARAFLKDARILLLDEATSALDAGSEARVQEAIARLTKGRTTIVIAHRLSTVRDADLIAVLDHGRIIERGSHEELMAKNGAYARLAKLQLA